MTTLLQANGITVWRGDTLLLDEIDMVIREAEVLQIQGANGSGKTTLLRVLCGISIADEGDISWCGEPVERVRDAFHADLLYLGHKPGISGALTPVENLNLFCALAGTDATAIPAALDALALGEREHVPCAALSAGQQRRVALARLLLQPARLWVLDEPLTALDANGLAWVQSQLAAQVARGGAVMFSTHQTLPLGDLPSSALALS